MRRIPLVAVGALVAGALAFPAPAPAAVRNPSNPTPIAVTDNGLSASTISVAGLGGVITDINARVEGVSHTYPDDLDLLLESPEGTFVMLMSDACGGDDVVAYQWNFDDEAAAPMTDDSLTGCNPINVRPTNFGASDPAASGPLSLPGTLVEDSMSAFDGENANGTWRIHVYDDLVGFGGSIANGFELLINTGPASVVLSVGESSSGLADPYPYQMVVGTPGKIADVDLRIDRFYHSFPDDVDVLLVSPSGKAVEVMSDACGSARLTNVSLTFDDEAAGGLPDGPTCTSGRVRPTNFLTNDPVYPAPAPGGPYNTALSAFDGEPANGTWRLFVRDDTGSDSGFVVDPPQLVITIDGAPETTIVKRPKKSTTKRKATIAFVANEAGASFQCKVDKKAWKPCASPLKLKKLKVGKHKVQVRAIDKVGNLETTPAVVKWRVRR
ncbi:hypothetical protein ACJ5H2_18015 [Nocardioides sp. R1-1]|uniref:hypothetical protein n=1 Tax=Nocardioides sp. R1-1 TaxID=3383502 RepID=UPI0038CFC9ED